MDLLSDTEAAKAILTDAEAADLALQQITHGAYEQWRKANEEMKKALAQPAAPFPG